MLCIFDAVEYHTRARPPIRTYHFGRNHIRINVHTLLIKHFLLHFSWDFISFRCFSLHGLNNLFHPKKKICALWINSFYSILSWYTYTWPFSCVADKMVIIIVIITVCVSPSRTLFVARRKISLLILISDRLNKSSNHSEYIGWKLAYYSFERMKFINSVWYWIIYDKHVIWSIRSCFRPQLIRIFHPC